MGFLFGFFMGLAVGVVIGAGKRNQKSKEVKDVGTDKHS